MFDVRKRHVADITDENREKQLQTGENGTKNNKNTPWGPKSLDSKGFSSFWQGSTDKKRDDLSIVSLVGEAGLEG